MAFVRQSKFRHVFGKLEKKENNYEDIRITKSALESPYCDVNPLFVAIVTDSAGGGAFLVLPLSKTGRLDKDTPLVAGHKLPVLDIKFNPFNDNMIASASEDCTVKIWEIPDEGLSETLTEPLVSLEDTHQKKISIIEWHPVVENVLLSLGWDNLVCIWNLDEGTVIKSTFLPEQPVSASWSYLGDKIAVTAKDKHLRVYDARTLEILAEKKLHEGSKPCRCVFLKDDRIFTTGFSRMSERQYGLWTDKLDELCLEEIDNSNGVIFPFYDPDTSLIYLCGKGDTQIRYFEVTDTEPYVHYLAMYQSGDPQKGAGMMPKRGVDVNLHEMTKFYKLVASGCQVVSMTVPRKSELFQADIYPDTKSNESPLTVDEWIAGKDSPPNMMSMHQFFKEKEGAGAAKKGGLKGLKPKKAGLAPKPTPSPVTPATPAPAKFTPAPAPATPAARPVSKPSPPADVPVSKPKVVEAVAPPPAAEPVISLPPDVTLQSLIDDIKELKATVKKHENRIEDLESKLQSLEENGESEEGAGSDDQ